ncbi:glutamine synthetase family protein [Williamwhitmania taraxaci]|uniref:L-glutamine synthetase n=1 Tax=Williamwhitmania taraxaci TaxID=1640674 RepID=A0A1G6IS14_9BACT|nr:glutamine synthetase family protein [Williamwhitmania taraxaci]SDC09220.1 L-glutamine synthetase [Williamwhitmania taraxaci]
MRDSEIIMSPNELVQYLKKPAAEFTKQDIINFAEAHEIEMVNFRYVAEDGKLKTLNFILWSKDHLDIILSGGERVDGSSLFSFIEAGSSDLYVIPKFRTAFVDPFAEVPTLNILCSFYNNEGKPLDSSPEFVLRKAHEEFRRKTGYTFMALGELEYYVIAEDQEVYPGVDQKGYHASEPYSKWEIIRVEALRYIARAGGHVKYGHSEVGCFTQDGIHYEQHEIEFLPMTAEEAVEQMVIAKWILRMLGYRYGVNISFAPKITVGKAGSGLHVHMMLVKDGKNMMVSEGKLSDTAKKMIAGILDVADALTAFGNTIPTSYLRLVPHQEAPTSICWGDRNRSVLIRVPLGWNGANTMLHDANPQDDSLLTHTESKQTVEIRTPDGSADLYCLLAGLVVGAEHGLTMPNALARAQAQYVDCNIFKEENKHIQEKLEQLPISCSESADRLSQKRAIFENNGIFPKGMIDSKIKILKSYKDEGLSEKLYGKHDEIKALVDKYIHIA